jgi:uncharacterized protein
MITKEVIDRFLSHPCLAIAGVSRNSQKFGAIIFRHMHNHGYQVYPVNPNITHYEGMTCYPDVTSLPQEVKVVVTVTKPEATLQVVQHALLKGIEMIWMQQGSSSPEAIALAEANGIVVVSGKCIMMFAEPVKSIHRFHRSLAKLFRKYPA